MHSVRCYSISKRNLGQIACFLDSSPITQYAAHENENIQKKIFLVKNINHSSVRWQILWSTKIITPFGGFYFPSVAYHSLTLFIDGTTVVVVFTFRLHIIISHFNAWQQNICMSLANIFKIGFKHDANKTFSQLSQILKGKFMYVVWL